MAAQPEPLLYAPMAARPEPQTLFIRSLITRELQQVAVEHGRTLVPLTDELKLLESGLDSLSLATVVIRLADSLGIDPFESGSAIEFPVTFGDFVRVYEALGVP
jgi:hypothetical protein